MNPTIKDNLNAKIVKSELDAFLVAKEANIRYITGFSGDSAYAAVNADGITLFVNSLYIEHARASVHTSIDIREIQDGLFETFASLGESFWGKRIGLEGDAATCSFLSKFRDAIKPAEPVLFEGMVEEFRERKEPAEIEAITKAQGIAEKVLLETLSMVREGVEERELALEIDYRIRKSGADRSSFDTIVASGPNTSKPHAMPTRRKLRSGDFVLFDMGAVVDGYSSDMTRMVVLGKADSRQQEVYSVVLRAQEAALAGIIAGMRCEDADRLARDVIEKAMLGKEFVHSLGHGIGLEIHESPRLSSHSGETLKSGAVITVEPGVYIPDWGGVRIEDMVVVVKNGVRNLTAAPKQLIEL